MRCLNHSWSEILPHAPYALVHDVVKGDVRRKIFRHRPSGSISAKRASLVSATTTATNNRTRTTAAISGIYPPGQRLAAQVAGMQALAELGTLVERAEEAKRVHLAGEDREEEVEVRLRERGRARVVREPGRVTHGVDDRGGEHAGRRERGGLPGDRDDVRERAVEVG